MLYILAEQGSDPNNTWWGIVPILLVVVPLVFWFCAVVSIVRSGFGWGVKLLLVLAALAYPLIEVPRVLFLGVCLDFYYCLRRVLVPKFGFHFSWRAVAQALVKPRLVPP